MYFLRLPRSLVRHDALQIYDTDIISRQWFRISLTEGTDKPDLNNVPFYIKLDFMSDGNQSFEMGSKLNGNNTQVNRDEDASNFAEEELALELKFDRNTVDPILNGSSLKRISFENKLENISFIVIEGDFNVKRLTFEYS